MSSSHGSKTPLVLVVDDEPAICELLVDALADTGYEVCTACSGREAINLAREQNPDIIVTDIELGDRNGLDVIDDVRSNVGDIPAVVITGRGNVDVFANASRRRPVELMTKPPDIRRLRDVICQELDRQAKNDQLRSRNKRLRGVVHAANKKRKKTHRRLNATCEDLATAYDTLRGQMAMQKVVLAYQRDLIAAKTDDDVFRSLFSLYVNRSGPVYGAALVCNATAELQIVGRFGVPTPDSIRFCEMLSQPIIDALLTSPQTILLDAGDECDLFDKPIQKFLPGLTILAVPLLPTAGEMIGVVLLYRKGEQPFTDNDVALAEMIATPIATAIRRND